MSAPALRARGVHLRTEERAILEGISLDVTEGEVVLVTGPNGAGKSALLAVLSTAVAPSRGSLDIFGMDTTVDPTGARRRLGYVHPGAACYPALSVLEHLSLFAGLHALEREHAVVEAVLELADLTALGPRPCGHLSDGERVRLTFATALLHDPDLLFLDDPTRGLDPQGAAGVRELLCELASLGKTLVWASHETEEVAAVSTRVLRMDRGRLTDGTQLAAPEAQERTTAAGPSYARTRLRVPEKAEAGARTLGRSRGVVRVDVLDADTLVVEHTGDEREIARYVADLTSAQIAITRVEPLSARPGGAP